MNELCRAAFCFHSNTRIATKQWIVKSTMSTLPGDDPKASSWNHTCCSAPSRDLESHPSKAALLLNERPSIKRIYEAISGLHPNWNDNFVTR